MSYFSLKQALLLSSQSKAYTYIQDPTKFTLLTPLYAYKLVASHYPLADPGERDTFTLSLYRTSYIEGELVVAKEPHKTTQKQGLDIFEAHLVEYGFPVDDGWLPLENEEAREKTGENNQ